MFLYAISFSVHGGTCTLEASSPLPLITKWSSTAQHLPLEPPHHHHHISPATVALTIRTLTRTPILAFQVSCL